jgi:hypothetical protein
MQILHKQSTCSLINSEFPRRCDEHGLIVAHLTTQSWSLTAQDDRYESWLVYSSVNIEIEKLRPIPSLIWLPSPHASFANAMDSIQAISSKLSNWCYSKMSINDVLNKSSYYQDERAGASDGEMLQNCWYRKNHSPHAFTCNGCRGL